MRPSAHPPPATGRRARGAVALLLCCLGGLPAAAVAAEAEGWVPLFDGESLDGWTVKIRGHEVGEDWRDTFRVEEGRIRVSYDGYDAFDDRFGHLFYDGVFSRYRLRVEYRFVGEQCAGGPEWAWRNSGVMVHGQSVASMGLDQEFPDAVEVQFLGGDGSARRPTANLCTPGTAVVLDGRLEERHCVESSSATYAGDGWVTVEVEVLGGKRIRHLVEGEVVLEYSRPQLDDGTPLDRGTISLQAESHPVEFRRVELLELPER